MKRYKDFYVWLPLVVLGVALVFMFPTIQSHDKGIPQGTNWPALIGQICIGLGSVAAIIRGIVEFAKLILPKRRES